MNLRFRKESGVLFCPNRRAVVEKILDYSLADRMNIPRGASFGIPLTTVRSRRATLGFANILGEGYALDDHIFFWHVLMSAGAAGC
jgi:hypothetical protein